MNEKLIYHVFADDGIEGEALSDFGQVVQVGWDIRSNDYTMEVQADANSLPLKKEADLAVLHPPCGKWAAAPRSYDQSPKDYPNHIDLAREIGQEYAEHHIIENVPKAPLNDPVVLNGHMFALPLKMERAFETSFDTPEPPAETEPSTKTDWWNDYARDRVYWQTIKGYSGDYRKDPLLKSAIPRDYVNWLLRHWICEVEDI